MQIDFLNNEKTNDFIFENNIKLATLAKIMNSSVPGNLFLGMSSCINRCVLGKYIGVAYFSYLADLETGSYSTFGSRISIGAFSHPTDGLTIHEVGYRNTIASYGETVYKNDAEDYLLSRSVKTIIGNDVWVGDNSVVIKGINIGDGAVVAAGSVVTKDVAPYSIVAGNPARLIRKRFNDNVIERLLRSKWWEYSMEELKGVPFDDVDKSLEILEQRQSK